MRVAMYARVSTLNLQHPEMHLSALREYSARRGWADSSERLILGMANR
jgi:DNA invertase Pin-like site-specific DNA recombinase